MKLTPAHVRKLLVALATALSILSVLLADGLTGQEWIAVALSFLGALGVYAVPNRPATPGG